MAAALVSDRLGSARFYALGIASPLPAWVVARELELERQRALEAADTTGLAAEAARLSLELGFTPDQWLAALFAIRDQPQRDPLLRIIRQAAGTGWAPDDMAHMLLSAIGAYKVRPDVEVRPETIARMEAAARGPRLAG